MENRFLRITDEPKLFNVASVLIYRFPFAVCRFLPLFDKEIISYYAFLCFRRFLLSAAETRGASFLTEKVVASDNAKTVLLAEDDRSVRRLLEVVLGHAGYVVISAEDGAEALQKAFEKPFDVAVLDAMMPNLSGYELCRIFRSHPNFQHLPLVLLSGREAEITSEADVYLLKNSNMQDKLLEILARLLKPQELQNSQSAKDV